MRIPLWVEMRGRRVLVVGGGRVGARRALLFRGADAEVRVVGLEFSRDLVEASRGDPGIQLVRLDAGDPEALRPHVEWADIVVIATSSPGVNETVWRLATSLGRWVNDATDASRTQVVVPYTLELLGGAVRVAVTSEGRSGVVARRVRDAIKGCLEDRRDLAVLYEVMWRVKPVLKALIGDGRKRFPVYFRVEEAVEEAAGRGDLEAALERAAEVIAEAVREAEGRSVSPGEVLELLRRAERPVEPLRLGG